MAGAWLDRIPGTKSKLVRRDYRRRLRTPRGSLRSDCLQAVRDSGDVQSLQQSNEVVVRFLGPPYFQVRVPPCPSALCYWP